MGDQLRIAFDGPTAARVSADAGGRIHDLGRLRDAVNERYFDGRLDVGITWGRGAPGQGVALSRTGRGRRRGGFSIRLGSYHHVHNLVRIHPVLDRIDVPAYVVESIVYHEMLHAALPPVRGTDGRRRIHTAEFRRRERLFERHAEAERWLASHVARLAAARRRRR